MAAKKPDKKLEDVRNAIGNLFCDRGVSVATARARMEELRDDIEMRLDSLPDESGDDEN